MCLSKEFLFIIRFDMFCQRKDLKVFSMAVSDQKDVVSKVEAFASSFRDELARCSSEGSFPKSLCTFDYFKCSFFWDWRSFEKEDSERTTRLFELLHLDPKAFDVLRGDCNFGSRVVFNSDTFLLYHPQGRCPDGVREYFQIEMTGSACRSFELRGGDWFQLFSFVMSVDHRCTRIDLAMDDIHGCVPLEDSDSGLGLKSRCRDMLFTSSFRRRKAVRLGSLEFSVDPVSDDEFDDRSLIDNPKGWSCTFGKVNNVQLQIYDKLKERLAHGVHTNLSSWVRFEMRFGTIGDRADMVLYLSYFAMLQKGFGVFCSQLLCWLIQFCDVPSGFSDFNHLYRFPVWKPFSDFVGGVSSNSLPCCNGPIEASVTSSVSWIMNQWASTLVTLCKISRRYMLSVLANSMSSYLEEKGISNSINGIVSTFFLMFPDELGKYDQKKSDKEVADFVAEFGDGVVRDGKEDTSDGGIFAWNDYNS